MCTKIFVLIKMDSPEGKETLKKVLAMIYCLCLIISSEAGSQTLLASICYGHHWCLESYHKLVDPDHDTRYKETECEGATHDLKYWFCECYALTSVKQRVSGQPVVELDRLTADPEEAITYARAALGF